MRDVEDAHDAVDQRQPGRHQEQPGRVDDAVERNGQDVVHGSEAAAAAGGRRLRGYFFRPDLIQASLFMPSGGVTFSAG